MEINDEKKTNGKLPKEIDQGSPEDPKKKGEIIVSKAPFSSLLPVVGVYGTIVFIIIWASDRVQIFLKANFFPISVLFGFLIILLIIFFAKRGISVATTKRKIGLIIFVVIPTLLGLVSAIVFIPDKYEVAAFRSIFLLIVCLLPALLYYLFIASRKTSLLQEYLTNISRLGLLRRQFKSKYNREGNLEHEFEKDRRIRVLTYIQKFEAIYGSIPEGLTDEILISTDPENSEPSQPKFQSQTKGIVGGIFTPETTFPVVIATLLIWLGWLLVLPPWENINFQGNENQLQRLSIVLKPHEIPVYFAFLGAYFFSLQMLFRRYVRKDLRGSAYVAVTLRIILAVIGTWAVLQAVDFILVPLNISGSSHRALLVVGFVIGAFPPIAWQVIQEAFKLITGARFLVPSLRSTMPVSDLDGLTVWHQVRLEEEDIENVPNMATADLVELILNTRFPPDRIVDWVDQAILYTQIGPYTKTEDRDSHINKRQLLRDHGIRTASELIDAYEKSEIHKDKSDFEKIISNQGRSQIRTLVDTLSTNPNLELVKQWRNVNQQENAEE